MGFHIEQTSRALYAQALEQNAVSSTITLEQYTQILMDSGNFVYVSAISRSQVLFWMMAFLVGTVQGGIPALSRSFFGKLVSPEKSNEFLAFMIFSASSLPSWGPCWWRCSAGLPAAPPWAF